MIKGHLLKQLEKKLPSYPHVSGRRSLADWTKQGKPYCWVAATSTHELHDETIKKVQLLCDAGHGWMAIVVNDCVEGVGCDKVFSDDRRLVGIWVDKPVLYAKV